MKANINAALHDMGTFTLSETSFIVPNTTLCSATDGTFATASQ